MTFWEEKRNDLYCSMLRSPAATLLKNGQQNSLALHRDNLTTTLTQPLGLSRPVTGVGGWFCKWISGAGEATSCWETEQKPVQQLRTKFQLLFMCRWHLNLLLSFITPFPNDLLKPTRNKQQQKSKPSQHPHFPLSGIIVYLNFPLQILFLQIEQLSSATAFCRYHCLCWKCSPHQGSSFFCQ